MKLSVVNDVFVLLGCADRSVCRGRYGTQGRTGKTIIRYVVEPPAGMAPAGTKDPARQVGLFLCFPEHDTPVGRRHLPRPAGSLAAGTFAISYVLLAGGPQAQKFGMADMEPIEKLIAWAKKTYPINPRRVYMFGKGEGGKISAEFTMTHPNIVTAAISIAGASG